MGLCLNPESICAKLASSLHTSKPYPPKSTSFPLFTRTRNVKVSSLNHSCKKFHFESVNEQRRVDLIRCEVGGEFSSRKGKRTDLKKILILGAGPIVIGQACEFDYSGTQACKALKEEGYEVILINSNPATIMTDPDLADRTYITPMTPELVEQVLEKERPDAILPTMGGQTALNLACALAESGALEKYGVELIGAKLEAIKKAEDRDLFKQAMKNIGVKTPASGIGNTLEECLEIANEIGEYPLIIRPAFTLGGSGGGIAYNKDEFEAICKSGLAASVTTQVLVEKLLLEWKEYELEVMRDLADNVVIICSIENIDPMGVHTGDSITVAPAQTLTDKEYQRLRDYSIAIIREIGVECGGSNVQFAVNPVDGEVMVIEMNPRLSRSSALASKATGFPIAKMAAKLSVGYALDQIPNDITRKTPASFEPSIDYVVTKIPRFAFEKFPGSQPILTTQMKSVGESMALGRTFQESFQKAVRSLETGFSGWGCADSKELDCDWEKLKYGLRVPSPERIHILYAAMKKGMKIDEIYDLSYIDKWFLTQLRELIDVEQFLSVRTLSQLTRDDFFEVKKRGFSDKQIAFATKSSEKEVRAKRVSLGVTPAYKRVDTCAAEFDADTPYMYSSYDYECEASPTTKKKVLILGGGPNRIGQGIEFDYCCCHTSFALQGRNIIRVPPEPFEIIKNYAATGTGEQAALDVLNDHWKENLSVDIGYEIACLGLISAALHDGHSGGRLCARVNGVVCKDPKVVEASDFLFTKLHLPGNTSNAFGSKVTPVTVAQVPGLNTLGISIVRIDFAPWGLNSLHLHPRASEILTVLEGRLLVGFVTSNPENRLISKILEKGDAFVFPMGLIHFQSNIGYGNAVAMAALSSQNPGAISVANAVFGSNLPIPAEVLTTAFQLDKTVVDSLQAKF